MGTTQIELLKASQSFVYNLLTSGKLYSHLADIEEQAKQLFSRLVKQYAEKEGVTEQLKATDMMLWVQKMNNVRSIVQEIVSTEIFINNCKGTTYIIYRLFLYL